MWNHICEVMTLSNRKDTSGQSMTTSRSQNPDSWLPADETSGLQELINSHLSLLFRLHLDTVLSLVLKSFLARHNLMYYVKWIYFFSITSVHSFIWYTILQFCCVLLHGQLNNYLKPSLRKKNRTDQSVFSAPEHQTYPGF